MNEEMNQLFDKMLVARYSPENKCFAEEGAVLIVLPRKHSGKPKESVSHYFVDSRDGKTRSRYGWVKSVKAYKFEDFVNWYGHVTDENEISHLLKMLEGISNLASDTPVAATYFERGIEQKQLEFKVHKVFFR